MKFSASLRIEALPHLIGITSALQRLSRGGPPGSCCLKLSPKKLSLNTRQSSCELYAELDMAEVFSAGWILESKRNNCVALQIEPRQLLGTLKLAQNCARITVKLAKRSGQGALVFEFTDLHLANVWITQDCRVVPLQGQAVDEAGTPEIPPCKSNLELPRVKSLLQMLERLRKLGSDEVTLEGNINPHDSNAFDLAVSAASDLVTAKAMYTRCCRLVPEGQEAPAEVSFVRSVVTKHLIAGLKALLDCSNSQDGLVALLVPEDESLHGWLSVVLQNEVESFRVLLVLPTVTHKGPIE
ncbi:hypothetical protein, conserved [Eimeria maxima]|uniref:Checkpoint protein n=1 Tax=Eimeria maxima TaxID=5804 RepID=U6LXU9_EIMMA|nr:hypothetical protein, conserved [Eimeria maxima]CDJ56792.1 hypothetical protein, conserved [Eimeria maxima]